MAIMAMRVTGAQVAAIGGSRAKLPICDAVAGLINSRGHELDLDTTSRVSHFLGQSSVESAGFSALAESLNYSVDGLRKTFGRHRITDAQCRRLGRAKGRPADQRGIANIVYGGAWGKKNLGNTEPNDGWDFRGSSIKQVTGRSNFRAFSKWIRKYAPEAPDFEAEPDRLRDPEWAAWGAVWYWSERGCARFADQDDVIGLTKRINGGANGLKARQAATAKAKRILKAGGVVKVKPTPKTDHILKRGAKGEYVLDLQKNLTALGYGPLVADGDFGKATEAAVKAFQTDHGLRVDGWAGNRTQAAIGKALEQPKVHEAEKKAEKAEERVETAKKAAEKAKDTAERGSFWSKVLSVVGGVLPGVGAWLSGIDWKVFAIFAAIAVVLGIGGLVIGPWAVRRFKDIEKEARVDA